MSISRRFPVGIAIAASLALLLCGQPDLAGAGAPTARSKPVQVNKPLRAQPKLHRKRAAVTGKPQAMPRHRPGTGRSHPLSTYRLQLTPSFGFAQAQKTLPYLSRLGIRTVYLSPVLAARSGSQHGYDVADPHRINPELGGERGFRQLIRQAKRHGLDLVIDIVPNHMGVSAENKLWDDVLAHGRGSTHADTFDIDWGPNGKRKLILPELGDAPEQVVARGELRLAYQGAEGFRIRYHDKSYPIDPRTIATAVLDSAGSAAERPARLVAIDKQLRALPSRSRGGQAARAKKAKAIVAELHRAYRADPAVRRAIDSALATYNQPSPNRARWGSLLGAQAYRLTYWKDGAARVNYRRFFTINELAAVRQEDPRVFEAMHKKIFELVGMGKQAGMNIHLRVDHPDGLADPGGTLKALRRGLSGVNPDSQIWVESILAKGQDLPGSWPVAGTTGYDFLNELGRTQIDRAGFAHIDSWYRRSILAKPGSSFHKAVASGKRQMLRSELAPDVRYLVERLERLAGPSAVSRSAVRDVLIDVIVAMPVYRSYQTRERRTSAVDRERLTKALAEIAPRTPDHRRAAELLRRVLLEPAGTAKGLGKRDRHQLITRFQQLTAATMAKGLEDTAHYRDYALASLNEVGGAPDELGGDAIGDFHRAAARRDPRAMLAATTHDTKRSADARTRLSVLSWMPSRWTQSVDRWRSLNQRHRGRVDANTEYLVYQTAVALWPRTSGMPSARELDRLTGRVEQYMIKASREAKRKTRWSAPDAAFEADLSAFVRGLLSAKGGRPFLRELAQLVADIDRPAVWASLSRTVAHYSAPGTADTYQGDELWNLTAVDPDNRRPVDFERRNRLLAQVERFDRMTSADQLTFARELADRPQSDQLKLHVVRQSLQARANHPDLFGAGRYRALETSGHGPSVLAFARSHGKQVSITLAPQGPGKGRDLRPTGRETWQGATLRVPKALRGATLINQMTGEKVTLSGSSVPISQLLGAFPVGLWVGQTQ